ncbi:MAG: hypothetical protein MUC81_08250 [Bacteroidia bacterium]|jgi:hypothetical protein|nr:hypothetical protein [Bacteroidia bacterium]
MEINFRRLVVAISFLVCFLVHNSHAQYAESSKRIQVYVTKLNLANQQVQTFLQLKNASIFISDYTVYNSIIEFNIAISDLPALDSLVNMIGYVTVNSFQSNTNTEQIADVTKRLNRLIYENELLAQQLSDTLFPAYRAEELRRKASQNFTTITSLQFNVKELEESKNNRTCKVRLELNDELSTPNNSRVSFVNMPGIEFGYLYIENPRIGTSTMSYQGFAIKYMFTRGKSYFNLGVYKANENNRSDTSLINELFVINFGQDFYPKHFGRGKRKFLNLYTGYQAGGFILNRNNERNTVFVPNLNISFGVELFKTKHILIDNKASYFLPLNELNRNMRGILYQASFNFIF